jgi:cation diffusion facilitator family transporter
MALVAAVLSIALKEGMYWYTKAAAVKVRSDALMADAWHHRSDSLSSIGSLVGIGGAMLGFPILDPIASVIICLFIVKVSFEIFKDATDKMVDKACDDETIEAMKNVISGIDGVKGLDLIHTRLFGSKIYVDIEISADGELNLKQAHGIAENVHHTIEEKFADVKHCMVHVNPR